MLSVRNRNVVASARRDSGISMETTSTPKKKKQTWWFVIFFVAFFHLVSAGTLIFYHTPKLETLVLVFATWFVCMLGITAGYHRLWSHRSYEASVPVRIFLALAGAAAYQGSIKWWVLRHRLHHRYTDTEHDPYDSTKGFFYSHMGWMFEKPEYPRLKWIDKSDLVQDFVVELQHKLYPMLAICLGLLLPTYLGSLWDDALGGFLYGGFLSRIIIWHSTWFINSLAHAWGDQEFSHESSARGNVFLSILTLGEGYHSFHHQFPRDYRNGIAWTDFDPTKWFIAGLSFLNLTRNLKKIPDNVIFKGMLCTDREER